MVYFNMDNFQTITVDTIFLQNIKILKYNTVQFVSKQYRYAG